MVLTDSFLFAFLVACNVQFSYQKYVNYKDYEFDYVIVGAGSAGSVVANRLTEDPRVTVLLLEAGDVPTESSEIPYNFGAAFGTEMDWNYPIETQKHCCGIFTDYLLHQGRALGGGSALNAMMYTRGNRRDYDNWERLVGDKGWGYDALLPYFKKLEDYRIPTTVYDAPYHSQGGPITVSLPSFSTPIANAFLDAGEELKYPLTDINSQHQYGFSGPISNIKDGMRWGTYRGYLLPAKNRTNLQIMTKAFVTKLDINAKTKIANGVFFDVNRETRYAKANREVILSAGTIQSPKILILSGIGPRQTLERYQIPVIKDLPGVGQHLQDHPAFIRSLFKFDDDYPIPLSLNVYDTEQYRRLWNETRTGPFTCPNKIEGLAFFNSSFGTMDRPDLEFNYISSNLIAPFRPLLKPTYIQEDAMKPHVVDMLITLNRPKSIGNVTIRSNDPYDYPIINPNFLAEEDDVHALIEGAKIAEEIINSRSFRRFGSQLLPYGTAPGCEREAQGSFKHYECIVRANIISVLHPVSTCPMASDDNPMGVVDKNLKVRGIQRLRIVDASVMPEIPTCHTNVPTIMIAEKASDLIKRTQNVRNY